MPLSTDTEKYLSNEEKAATTDNTRNSEVLSNPNIVDWDGPNDPTNALNWTSKKKWANAGLLSVMTFIT